MQCYKIDVISKSCWKNTFKKRKELSTPKAVTAPLRNSFTLCSLWAFPAGESVAPPFSPVFLISRHIFQPAGCLSCSPWAPPLLPCRPSSATWLWLTSMLNFLAFLKTNFCSFFFPSSSSWQLMRSPSCLSGIFHSDSNTIVLKLPSESLTKFFGSQD